jgi:2-polyprenyl-6-methoxyphenol hydroxylase-like FAD-dependent oxidoreductase
MARVVIVGAGIGGLATALMLGREGRDVVLCERDPASVPASAEEMWYGWERPGIPQARLGHTFLAGFRSLLAERAPDVLERLLAAGAPLVDFSQGIPGKDRRAEDAEMSSIMCRRHVLEGILRQAVQAEAAVELRAGCDVVGLTAEPSTMAGVPRVVGVQTRDHGAVGAASVVIAGGRLAPIGRWLEAIDARPPEETAEGCGLVCFTRFFRINREAGEDHRVSTRLTVEGSLGFMTYEIFGADRGTFCVELIPPAWDHDLRELRHEDAHMAVARTLPESTGWLEPARATPIGPVAAMGQERNTLRRFTRDEHPIALGLHVIGDARCQTNSLYAWGSCNALAGAAALVDVLIEHPGDAEAQALDLEGRIGEELAGRHAYAVARDRALQRSYRGEPRWEDTDHDREVILRTVIPAAQQDAEVFRAVTRWELQLDPADALERNTAPIERARTLATTRKTTDGASTPTREALLETVAAHARDRESTTRSG